MARTSRRFSLNAIGMTTPTRARPTPFARIWAGSTETLRPHATGDTYVNFLDLDGATPERVRAAYSDPDRARLIALKSRYDPTNVFRFNRNIPHPIS